MCIHKRFKNGTMEGLKVFRLALTGGPCAGKTSALQRITDRCVG